VRSGAEVAGVGDGRVVFYRVPFGLHTVNTSRGKRAARGMGWDSRVTGICHRRPTGVQLPPSAAHVY